jgi:peroxiredoxin Q/BCP
MWLFLATMSVGSLVNFGSQMAVAKKSRVQVGDKAPFFKLPDQGGNTVSLKDLLGQKVIVLYFYPKDNTRVCTKEACSFRDSYQAFTDAGAEVIGVSSDDQSSHEKFVSEYHLPFKLLSDTHKKVRKLYGVPNSAGVIPGRVTYVIDKQGIVRLTFNSELDAEKHVSEAMRVIKEISTVDSDKKSDKSSG